MPYGKSFPGLLFLFFIFGWMSASASQASPEQVPAAKPATPTVAPVRGTLPDVGQPVDRDLKEGETHVFETTLRLGEYLEIVVEQRGIDAGVEITDAAGKSVMKIDTPTGAAEAETVGFVADRAGTYSVTVYPVIQPTSPKAGRYVLKVVARRVATARDRSFDTAMRALSVALNDAGASKVILQGEAAYTALLPMLGAGHPNVRAAALAYARKAASREQYFRAGQLAEPILAVREKDETAPPLEVLNWNAILLRGYGGLPYPTNEACKNRDILERLYVRDLTLKSRIFGVERPEVEGSVLALATFYRKCDPERVPPFMEALVADREAALGAGHPAVNSLIGIYGQSVNTLTYERFRAFIEERVNAVIANAGLDRRSKVAALITAANTYRQIFQGILIPNQSEGKDVSEDVARLVMERQRDRQKQARRIFEQALVIAEPDKTTMQREYFECLQGIRGAEGNESEGYNDRVIAFAEAVQTLEVPELVDELGNIAEQLKITLDSRFWDGCPDHVPDPTRTRERIRSIYEGMFRLAESAPLPPKAVGEVSPSEAPDIIRVRPANIDDVAVRYASFLFGTGDRTAATGILERGLAFRLKHEQDPVAAMIRYASSFDLAGDEARAEALYGESLRLAESAENEKVRTARLALCLPALAQFHERYERYDEAEKIYRRLSGIIDQLRRTTSADNSDSEDELFSVADEGLAWIAAVQGDEAAFAERFRTLNRKHPELFKPGPGDSPQATVLKTSRRWTQNLLFFYTVEYLRFGNHERAEALNRRMLAVTGNTPDDLVALNFAGSLLVVSGKTGEALPCLERAFLIQATANPVEAVSQLPFLLDLLTGQPDKAIGLLERIAPELEKIPDSEISRKYVLAQLAHFQERAGHTAEALRAYEKLAELGVSVDESLPVAVREQAALDLWRDGRLGPALRHQAGANNLRELRLAQLILMRLFAADAVTAPASESGMRRGCAPAVGIDHTLDFTRELDVTVSFHALFAPDDAAARRAAFESVLRRKERPTDALLDEVTRMNGVFPNEALTFGLARGAAPWNPWEPRSRAEKESASLNVVASSVRGDLPEDRFIQWCPRYIPFGSGSQEPQVEDEDESGSGEDLSLGATIRKLVPKLIAKRPDLRPLLTPVSVENVQKALPADAALVEVVRYAPFDPKAGATNGEERYAVYVLNPQGEPQWFDGGTVSEIDKAASQLANGAQDYSNEEAKAALAVLETRFISPALKLTGKAKRVYVAFDEGIAALPFGKMVDGQGKPFGDSRGLVFIRSGRELLTMNRGR